MSRASIANAIYATVLAAATTWIPSHASAACINGRFEFWWELGNYCDWDDRDCDDWSYTSLSQDTWVPLKEVTFLVETTGGTALVLGDTDTNGEFTACYSGTQSNVKLRIYPEHKSGDFKIHTSTGGGWQFTCNAPGSGNIGVCQYGSNGNPNPVASVYYTAYAMLKNTVNQMGGVNSGFTNVSIRMDSTASSTPGYDKIVKIKGDTPAEFGFVTVMHEMGHVADHMAARNRFLGPNSAQKGSGLEYTACGGTDNGVSFTSTDECADAIWTEGIAEFLAGVGRMHSQANNPCTSRASVGQECFDGPGATNLESNPGCPSSGNARLVQVTAYLWDTYDPSRATPIDLYDDALFDYPNGTQNREKSENWGSCDSSGNNCVRQDHMDKNVRDFDFHLGTVLGSTVDLLGTHCL